MRIPWTIVAIMATGSIMASPTSQSSYALSTKSDWNLNAEGVIKNRLAKIQLPFEAKANDIVLNRIKMYVSAGRRETETILGRTVHYFPIFEHYLRQHNLPAELKYLPMIESGLRPGIRSHAGAVGMWQLMLSTSRHYGLTVNDYIDERRDPYRSSEAAVRLLRDLYKMFGDWQLVLIAYNGGSGAVQKAIRQAGCKEYAEVRKYLPMETRLFVPRFIAAAYIANFYKEHRIEPRAPSTQLQRMRILEVHQYISFRDIADVTGLDVKTIAALNPACLRNAVPRARKGYYLVLPAGKTQAVREFLSRKENVEFASDVPPNTFRYSHVVRKGENLNKLADIFQCSVEDIMNWNRLFRPEVVVRQELNVYLTRAYVFNRA